MTRLTRLSTAAAALAIVLACHADRTVIPPVASPLFEVSDGATDGNADFFFLPPLVPNPSSDLDFEAGDFNSHLSPKVRVCRLSEPDALGNRTCEADVPLAPGGLLEQPAPLVAGEEMYKYTWDTDPSGLDPAKVYRVFAVIGDRDIGHADVQPVENGMKNTNTGETFVFQDGRTIPVKMRFENDALCVDPSGGAFCTSKTINLGQGGFVVLEGTGDRVDVPAQPDNDQDITLTLQLCDGIPVDVPTFGNCLSITDDPPLRQPLTNPATVSLCSLGPSGDLTGLDPEQQKLLKLLRFDGGPPEELEALPEAPDFCESIGSASPNGWDRLLAGLRTLVGPRPLHAASVAIDVGDAGSTDVFSFFQFALPAKMDIVKGTTGFQTDAGTSVPFAPAVKVTDLNDAAVAGVRVTFDVMNGNGTISASGGAPGTQVIVMSDADGFATLSAWTTGSAPARNTVKASGKGIADPVVNGPRPIFDPFTPDISLPLADQEAVPLQRGTLEFVAFGATETNTSLESGAGLAVFGQDLTLTATVAPAPPTADEPEMEFFDGETSLGTAAANASGVATLVTSSLSLEQHTLSARFRGTPTHYASTSRGVTQHVIGRFDVLSDFTTALGDAPTETQDFSSFTFGDPVSSIIPGVLALTSTFGVLEVSSCGTVRGVFGSDAEGNPTRTAGNGRYDLTFGASRNAMGFEIAAQDPATGPARVEVQTNAGTATFPVTNTSGDELTPTFLGMIASLPIQVVLVREGPEVSGTGNEEVCLANFRVASVALP